MFEDVCFTHILLPSLPQGGGGEEVDGVALVTAQNFPVTEVFTTPKMSYSMLLFISNHMNFNVRIYQLC